MSKPRPATFAQLFRLNRLKALKLVEPGDGQEIPATEADHVLADAAAQGLWIPSTMRKQS